MGPMETSETLFEEETAPEAKVFDMGKVKIVYAASDTTGLPWITHLSDQTAFPLQRITDPMSEGVFEVSHSSYQWLINRLESDAGPSERLRALFAEDAD